MIKPSREQDPERDRDIKARAILAHIGRGEVDGELIKGEAKACARERGGDAVAALFDGAIGKPGDMKDLEAHGDVDLDEDVEGFDAKDRRGSDACEHDRSMMKRQWSERDVTPHGALTRSPVGFVSLRLDVQVIGQVGASVNERA